MVLIVGVIGGGAATWNAVKNLLFSDSVGISCLSFQTPTDSIINAISTYNSSDLNLVHYNITNFYNNE